MPVTGSGVSWTLGGSAGFINSPDLTTPAQIIVNLGGFASGDAMACVAKITSAGSSTKAVEMWDGNTSEAAKLSITYTAGGSVPAAPTSFAIGTVTDTTIGTTWVNDPAGLVSDVAFYQNTVNNFGTAARFDLHTDGTSVTADGLNPGTTYWFWVADINASGEGAAAGPLSATTLGDNPVPVLPAGVGQSPAGGITNQQRKNRVEGTRYSYN